MGKLWECYSVYPVAKKLEAPSQNSKLIETVFENETILDKVLESVCRDSMNLLKLRLVNRTFNATVLHRIRKEHIEVRIGEFKRPDEESAGNDGCRYDMTINYRRVHPFKSSQYFRFLKQIAGVKVRKLRVEEFYGDINYEMLHQWIHEFLIAQDDHIVEEFVGLGHLLYWHCSECTDILNNGRCRKYGQLRMEDFNWKSKAHFDHLAVSDEFNGDVPKSLPLLRNADLCLNLADQLTSNQSIRKIAKTSFSPLLLDIACKCDYLVSSPEEYFPNLETIFKPLITCDHLQVILKNTFSKSQYREIGEEQTLSHTFPREVLNMMIVKWRVKTLQIDFEDCEERWCPNSTEGLDGKIASFDVPFETQKVSNFFLESVDIHLNCPKSLHHAKDYVFLPDEPFPLEDLIANSRRLFPTNNFTLSLATFHEKLRPESMDIFIPKMMKMAEMEMKRNFNLTVKLYQIPFPIPSSVSEIEIPDIFQSGARLLSEDTRDLDCFLLQEVVPIQRGEEKLTAFKRDITWNGMVFKLRNKMQNCNIDFEIDFEKDFLKRLKEVWTEVKHIGFLRHYLNLY